MAMALTESQVLVALFVALFPGILAYKLCTELYRA
jgi:photosystem I reaction center subunit XII